MTSLVPSALSSGAGTSESWEEVVALPSSVGPEQSRHKAKAQNCKEGSPLEGKSLKPGLGKWVMASRRRWSFGEPDILQSHRGFSFLESSPGWLFPLRR